MYKKIIAVVMVLFLVPTVAISASEYSVEDCINYMDDFFNNEENNDNYNGMMDEDYNAPCHGDEEE